METTILSRETRTPLEESLPPISERTLPSGRSVVLKIANGCEDIEVRSINGDVEVRISLSDSGAVVTLRGGRLEMESADAIALNCRRFEVATAEGTTLSTAGDTLITAQGLCVKTEGDIHMNGGIIHLNC